MKTKIFFLISFTSAIVLLGCSKPVQKQSAAQVLSDTETQNQIMTAISNSHPMMMNMMGHMMQSEHAMQMMTGNTQMMSNMMQGIINMAANDSAIGRRMSSMMMTHPNMMNMMMGMMYNKGMIDKQCMMKAQKNMGGMQGNMMNNSMRNHMDNHN